MTDQALQATEDPEEQGQAEAVPVVPWTRVETWLDGRWEPGEHMSIFGRTGSGKTYVLVYGLMPLWARSRVLIIDSKHDRGTMREVGHVVSKQPGFNDRLPFRVREWTGKPESRKWDDDPEWYKLQPVKYKWHADRTREKASLDRVRAVVGKALQMVYEEGDWVVILDEVRDLSESRSPGLDLGAILSKLWREGRDRNVTIIAGTQAPAMAPPSMYDQCTYAIFGRNADLRRTERLGEIAGNIELVEQVLPQLQEHELLIMDLYYDKAVVSEVD